MLSVQAVLRYAERETMRKLLLNTLCLTLLLWGAGAAVADSGGPRFAAETVLFAKKPVRISLRQAVGIAKNSVPGKVLSARQSRSDGGAVVYRVKILTPAGVVRTVLIDGRSGARLGMH